MSIVILLIIMLAFTVIGIVVYDTNHFVIRKYEIKDEKGVLKGEKARLVFLSDLHGKSFGKDNEILLKAVDELDPDAVLIGGDMITARPGYDITGAVNFCAKLCGKYQVYYADGNHEYRLSLYPETYGTLGEDLDKALKDAGVIRIDDVNAAVIRKDDKELNIVVSGLHIESELYHRFRLPRMEDDYVKEHLGDSPSDKYHIVLAHDPDHFYSYCKYDASLFLAGHVHGGIARIPFIGGVISPRFRLFPKYDGGFYEENGVKMIISRGLGTHTLPVRFLNPGELVLIEIK